ncbi:MAG: hypothetical protein IJZ22_05430 [Bacteroidaceae bacterium]|nr:hypothetical protein [Bacteroidaceae bacterium]
MGKHIIRFLWALLVAIIILIVGSIIEIASYIHAAFGPDNDDFGKRHVIPAGLVYNQPMDEGSTFKAVDSLATDTYLQIYNNCQGGMYLYDFHHPALPAGDIYLKCYEATKSIPLSKERIEEASKVHIETTASFTQLVNQKNFTIYEGVWGDYYAARIEVWHRNAVTGEKTKLLEKIYRVEGWER